MYITNTITSNRQKLLYVDHIAVRMIWNYINRSWKNAIFLTRTSKVFPSSKFWSNYSSMLHIQVREVEELVCCLLTITTFLDHFILKMHQLFYFKCHNRVLFILFCVIILLYFLIQISNIIDQCQLPQVMAYHLYKVTNPHTKVRTMYLVDPLLKDIKCSSLF